MREAVSAVIPIIYLIVWVKIIPMLSDSLRFSKNKLVVILLFSNFRLPNLLSYMRPCRQYCTFLHHHNTILYRMSSIIAVRNMFAADDFDIVADVAVFIKDCLFYIAVFPIPILGRPALSLRTISVVF